MVTQATLLQIDNYGPWTVTPAPRPEADLQSMQARLYAELASQFGARGGYTFFARFDNVVALTQGVGRDAHARVQASVSTQFPVTVSAGIGTGETPVAALEDATGKLQSAGGAQDADRESALVGDPTTDPGPVHLAHFDVVDMTERYTDVDGAYSAHLAVQRTYLALADRLHEHGGVAFFVGGDNVIAACPALDRDTYESVIAAVREAVGVDLRVGVGRADIAVAAGMRAKHALEACREQDRRIRGDLAATERSGVHGS